MAERGEGPPGREMSSWKTPRWGDTGLWEAREAREAGVQEKRAGVVKMRLKLAGSDHVGHYRS